MVESGPGELRQCDMILMDSSPLIYLAKAGRLDLLLKISRRIYVPDEVYYEAAGRWYAPYAPTDNPPPDAELIKKFTSENHDRFQIVPTQLGSLLQRDRLAGVATEMDNAGEMAAVSVYERRKELTGNKAPVLVIFEDTEIPVRLTNKNVHLLSTFGFFLAMEKAGYLVSAQDAYDAIPFEYRPSGLAVDKSVRGDTSYGDLVNNP
jgi:hypothetical protein